MYIYFCTSNTCKTQILPQPASFRCSLLALLVSFVSSSNAVFTIIICATIAVDLIGTKGTSSALKNLGHTKTLLLSSIDVRATRQHHHLIVHGLFVHFANRDLTSHNLIEIGAQFRQMAGHFTKLAEWLPQLPSKHVIFGGNWLHLLNGLGSLF